MATALHTLPVTNLKFPKTDTVPNPIPSVAFPVWFFFLDTSHHLANVFLVLCQLHRGRVLACFRLLCPLPLEPAGHTVGVQ